MTFSPRLVHSDGTHCADDAEHGSAFPTLIADTLSAEDAVGFPRDPQIFKIAAGSIAFRLHRDWIADLQGAILNADLSNPAEFHALFSIITGFGLAQTSLAVALGKKENTVSRYATGASSPSDASSRRGVLLEAYRHLQNEMINGSLPIMKFYQKPVAGCVAVTPR